MHRPMRCAHPERSPSCRRRPKGAGAPPAPARSGLLRLVCLLASSALVTTTFAATGHAAGPSSYTVSVPVVDVEPVLASKSVERPVRQCRTEEVMVDHRTRYHSDYRRHHYDEPNTFVPGILGGLVGGLIGNQFGGGSGKKALTVIGALAGPSIAQQSVRQRHHREVRDYRDRPYYDSEPRRICTTTYETEIVEEVTGYDVTYEYGGQLFSKRTSHHPGERLRVRVAVSPEPVTGPDRG